MELQESVEQAKDLNERFTNYLEEHQRKFKENQHKFEELKRQIEEQNRQFKERLEQDRLKTQVEYDTQRASWAEERRLRQEKFAEEKLQFDQRMREVDAKLEFAENFILNKK
jgi:hypothetical protein